LNGESVVFAFVMRVCTDCCIIFPGPLALLLLLGPDLFLLGLLLLLLSQLLLWPPNSVFLLGDEVSKCVDSFDEL
jgi:hypothetical protein